MAEKILEVTERVLQESSSAQPVLLRSTSSEVSKHSASRVIYTSRVNPNLRSVIFFSCRTLWSKVKVWISFKSSSSTLRVRLSSLTWLFARGSYMLSLSSRLVTHDQ